MSDTTEKTGLPKIARVGPIVLLSAGIVLVPYDDLTSPTTEFLFATLVAVTTACIVMRRRITIERNRFAYLVPFFILSLTFVVTPVFRGEGVVGILETKPVLTHIVLVFAFLTSEFSSDTIDRVLWFLTVVTAVLGILSVLHGLFGLPFGNTRSGARTFGSVTFPLPRSLAAPFPYGSYGLFSIIGLSYLLSIFYLDDRSATLWHHPRRYLTLGGILVGVLVSQSRSTYVAVTLILCMYFIYYVLTGDHDWTLLKQSADIVRRNGFFIIVISSVVALLGVWELLKILPSMMTGDGTLALRLRGFANALEVIQDRPLTGCGRSCIFSVTEQDVPVHNYWLAVGVYVGPIGLIASLIPFLMVLRSGISQALSGVDRKRATGILLVSVVIGSSVELALHPGLNATTGILLGILGVLVHVSPFARYTHQPDE